MCAVISPSESAVVQPRRQDGAARTHGEAEVTFSGGSGGTRLTHLYQRAPLRALFPVAAERGLANAVLINTTGGLVGGDRLEVRVGAEAGAAALVTTQAAEKVYRSRGADCQMTVDLTAGGDSWLEWLPQETILFEGARLDRTTRIACGGDSRVLAGEILVFGRTARGERLTRGRFRDAWEVRRDGRLVWADALSAAGDLAKVLALPVLLAGAAAVATVLYVGNGSADALALARDLTAAPGIDMAAGDPAAGGDLALGDLAVAVTCVAGVLVVRWLSRDARLLRQAFGRFWAAFRHRIGGRAEALPRVWCL
jgi:urease accessory protein